MSEQKPTVAIVGLGEIGASVGLCLRRAGAASQLIGHDKAAEAGSRAKKIGAVDRTEWNLVSACEKADLVLLALPFAAVRETLEAIAPYIRPGCVVLEMSALKAPAAGWADAILSPEAHFVGLSPIVPSTLPAASARPGAGAPPAPEGGPAAPRADLFQGGLICVVPSRRAAPEAVQLATDLVAILGARPLFLDAIEHDGLMALVHQVPPLLSLALLRTAAEQPSWKEMRKLAGAAFETGTRPLASGAAEIGQEWLANRDNLVRWLDALSTSLEAIREVLAEGDAAALGKLVEQAERERTEWLRRSAAGDWGEGHRPEMPKRDFLQPFVGGLWRRKPKPAAKQ